MNDDQSGYSLKLTSIGSEAWQLFLAKLDDSSDFVRVVYGVTEQAGGSARNFQILRKYLITPQTGGDQVFMYQFEEYEMKNRRVWVAFQTVKREKGKRGKAVATYIALSPVQSKWRTRVGSSTSLDIKPLDLSNFELLFKKDPQLPRGIIALLEP